MKPHVPVVGLREGDRPYLQIHFLCLGTEDRRLRFGARTAPQAIREYVARIDFVHDRIFAVQGEEGSLVAVVHVAVSGGTAELGLSVLSGWRGRGIGTALLARAITHLRNCGVRRAFLHCLAENAAIMHIARKLGGRLELHGSENQSWLALDPPNAETLSSEWVDDQVAAPVSVTRQALHAVRTMCSLLTLPARSGR